MDIFKVQERAETIRAYKRVFESDDGKKILKDLMKACHFLSTTMHVNPNEAAYKEGERSVLLRILKTVKINADEVEHHLKEQNTK